jgi:CRP/FNR family cyclic AMP-dependent transcriptional regulator
MIDQADPLTVLAASPVFAALPAAAAAELATLAREEVYDRPTLLAARDTRPGSLWHVLAGGVEVGLFSAGGRPAVLGPILPGGWATWLSCFHDAPLPHDLWTGPETRLLAFPAATVRRLALENPQVYPPLIALVGDRMRDLIGWSLAAGLASPERRMAWLLSSLCRPLPGDGPHRLRLTQDHLAATGFGTRQRAARLLAALQQRGLVEHVYGAVAVPSRARLEAFAAL